MREAKKEENSLSPQGRDAMREPTRAKLKCANVGPYYGSVTTTTTKAGVGKRRETDSVSVHTYTHTRCGLFLSVSLSNSATELGH